MPLRLRTLSALLMVSALAVYGVAMIPPLLLRAIYGPICSGHPAGALHCPACYVAAALAIAALASAAAAVLREQRPSLLRG